ncbi:glucan endo-1,3-beta-glucosidase 14 isoform X2 [Brachypodium distachyon]|uniref:glucan endo-1,3-beta-glucosidase 14 isoform X2 n=1 Tax=Brachypodium distachyon TaxID=15368 RepID=UPI0001C73203|nr:glucan endo-1,3-beta-glucosidase 14 isoform X2 [Brachypodium distachyon]|eukprot:XP_003564669.2 glucan endo-1,3-beta-glucosidase 14 isoform X2 [Brachypodium distachyon]
MEPRARASSLLLCLMLSLFSVDIVSAQQRFGINYGQIADNLPDPTQVVRLLRSMNVNKVKLYDADSKVLTSFANTGVEFIISVGNENLQTMATTPGAARQWVSQHVQPFIPATRISCVIVGNEVLGNNDNGMAASLVPAMQAIYDALVDLGLSRQVTVSSAHSVNVLASSFPPSSGVFQEGLAQYIKPLLEFHSKTGSPFLINAYPFFAYKGSPGSVSLPYVLFEPNAGVVDPKTNLSYDNMLYAQIDAVYAAMKAMGHTDIGVRVSETGWPSKGDEDEVGATVQNAAAYNGNLMQRIAMNQGTPLKPEVPIDVFVFALFNENMKPGPASERNYGLFYPNGSPVYAINAGTGAGSGPGAGSGSVGRFDPYSSQMFSAASKLAVTFRAAVGVLLAALFL